MKLITRLTIFFFFFFLSGCTQDSGLLYPELIGFRLGNESLVIPLRYKEEIALNDSIKIRFDGVTADSRCPIDAVCIWAGDGEVNLNVSSNNSSKKYSLHTGLEPREIITGGYMIQLVNLMPAQRTSLRIRQEDYNIELRVTKVGGNYIRPVQLIDANYSGMIRRDMLNVSNVTLANDLLNFSVGYSGGCREHIIELFAQKEIAKSNPAQVTINLSHFADGDMCEAYVTKEIKFDLSPLKTFLKNNYNITDRIILNILDTSGRPVKNPGIEYKL
ncbi:MAG: hypothetical protein NTX65_09085 [Ignavibacteriales bacterium]|nr:hypothetical protein [Ignavibacteriales bacterium]